MAQMAKAAVCVLRTSHLANGEWIEIECNRKKDLRRVVRPARHKAEERDDRNRIRRESLKNPYRHQVHEMPSRIAVLAGRIAQR